MGTKFNSQICTSREQSERLIALGLKRETADMYYSYDIICAKPYYKVMEFMNGCAPEVIFPAWSLHRLIEMMPNNIHKYNDIADLSVSNELVQYRFYDVDYNHDICVEHFNDGTLFDNIIDCIEWLIKEGYFNKEYLVNQAEVDEHCKGVLEYLD